MSVYDNIITGSFTSDGTAKQLNLPSGVDYMEVINRTQWATTQATGRGVKFEWFRGLSAGQGFMVSKTNSTDALNGTFLTTGGFTEIDSSVQTPGPAQTGVAGTPIAKATSVVTLAAHGYSNGDIVRLTTTTGMLQIASMEFTISSVSTNAFTLAYLDASGFAANATAVTARRIPFDTIFYPRNRLITAITAGATTVVQMSVTHGLTVGQVVRVEVPEGWGMTQINGLKGEVLAINTTTNTITLDINSSSFTAFAFPTSAVASAGISFPQIVPVGVEAGGSLDDAETNTAFVGMSLAAGTTSPAGSSSDVIYWKALVSTQVQS